MYLYGPGRVSRASGSVRAYVALDHIAGRPAYQYGVLDASPKRAIKKLDTQRGNSVTVEE